MTFATFLSAETAAEQYNALDAMTDQQLNTTWEAALPLKMMTRVRRVISYRAGASVAAAERAERALSPGWGS